MDSWKIYLVQADNEDMILESLFNPGSVPRRGDMVSTYSGKFLVVKANYDYKAEAVFLSVTEVIDRTEVEPLTAASDPKYSEEQHLWERRTKLEPQEIRQEWRTKGNGTLPHDSNYYQ